MANEVIQDELAWDYTADEMSPLLRRAVSPHGRRDRPCALTHNQAQYLLHSLGEAAQVLRNGMRQRTPPEDSRLTEDRLFPSVHRLYQRCCRYAPYVPVLIVAIQVLTMLIETVIDACLANHTEEPHKPYVAAVLVSVSFLLILFLYVELVTNLLRQKPTLAILFSSFLSSSVLFASLYTVFYRFDDSGWVIPLKHSPDELYVVTFLRMTHTSISVFTLCNDASGITVVSWYPLVMLSIQPNYCCLMGDYIALSGLLLLWATVLLSATSDNVVYQMLLAYCHLVIIIATVFDSLLRHPTLVNPSNHTAESQQFQRDPDTESISFGTHLTPTVNSRPLGISRAADRASLHSNTEEAGAALLLSNSI